MQKQEKSSKQKVDWWKVIQIINIIAIILLGIFAYVQNEKINKLSRGGLRNDILISSVEEDTTHKVGEMITLSIKIDSNFEDTIPLHIELLEITNDKKKKITSGYELLWNSKQYAHIGTEEPMIFTSNLTMSKEGSYLFKFRIHYNYDTEEGFENGETELKNYELPIIFISN